jgi:hypothetical protein
MMTQMAKPLPNQQVDKGKVWALLVGGAVILFTSTLAAEDNGGWFPAIKKANEAMQAARKSAEEREMREAQQPTVVETVAKPADAAAVDAAAAAAMLPYSSLRAVEEGLAEAWAKAAAAEQQQAEAAEQQQAEQQQAEQQQAEQQQAALGGLMDAKEELRALRDEMRTR